MRNDSCHEWVVLNEQTNHIVRSFTTVCMPRTTVASSHTADREWEQHTVVCAQRYVREHARVDVYVR
jgi:hypothetical protein